MNRRELLKAIGLIPVLGRFLVKPTTMKPPKPVPPTYYVGLLTPDGEVSGLGYHRVPLAMSQGDEVVFPQAAGDWGEITRFALFPDPTVAFPASMGDFRGYPSREIQEGDTIRLSGITIA